MKTIDTLRILEQHRIIAAQSFAENAMLRATTSGSTKSNGMMTISDGVYEETERGFEAAIQTECGERRFLTGTHSPDWVQDIESVRSSVVGFATLEPSLALKEIGLVHEQAQRLVDLTNAKARICIGMLPINASTEYPAELDGKFDRDGKADSHLQADRQQLVRDSKRLIGMALEHLSDKSYLPDVSDASQGRVVVDWVLGHLRIQWELRASPIGWPGISVRSLEVYNDGRMPAVSTRIFQTAMEAVDHFRRLYENEYGSQCRSVQAVDKATVAEKRR